MHVLPGVLHVLGILLVVAAHGEPLGRFSGGERQGMGVMATGAFEETPPTRLSLIRSARLHSPAAAEVDTEGNIRQDGVLWNMKEMANSKVLETLLKTEGEINQMKSKMQEMQIKETEQLKTEVEVNQMKSKMQEMQLKETESEKKLSAKGAELDELKDKVAELERRGAETGSRTEHFDLHCRNRIADMKKNLSEFDCIAAAAGISLGHWNATHRKATLTSLEGMFSSSSPTSQSEDMTLVVVTKLAKEADSWQSSFISADAGTMLHDLDIGDFDALTRFDFAKQAITGVAQALPGTATAVVNKVVSETVRKATENANKVLMPALAMTNPLLGVLAGLFTTFLFKLFDTGPSLGDMLQEALSALYTKIMEDVQNYVQKEMLRAQLETIQDTNKNKMQNIVEEVTWVPQMLRSTGDDEQTKSTKIAWLLTIQHNLAELKGPVFHESCLAASGTIFMQSQVCKKWQASGTFVQGLLFAHMHLQILLEIVRADARYGEMIRTRVRSLKATYLSSLQRSFDMFVVSRNCGRFKCRVQFSQAASSGLGHADVGDGCACATQYQPFCLDEWMIGKWDIESKADKCKYLKAHENGAYLQRITGMTPEADAAAAGWFSNIKENYGCCVNGPYCDGMHSHYHGRSIARVRCGVKPYCQDQLTEAHTKFMPMIDALERLPGYKYKGKGRCPSGYYKGWADDGNLAYLSQMNAEKCADLCNAEPQCKYFALIPGKTCSRYDDRAGSCPLGKHKDHDVYAKKAYSRPPSPPPVPKLTRGRVPGR